jgi:hypothetical protein
MMQWYLDFSGLTLSRIKEWMSELVRSKEYDRQEKHKPEISRNILISINVVWLPVLYYSTKQSLRWTTLRWSPIKIPFRRNTVRRTKANITWTIWHLIHLPQIRCSRDSPGDGVTFNEQRFCCQQRQSSVSLNQSVQTSNLAPQSPHSIGDRRGPFPRQ